MVKAACSKPSSWLARSAVDRIIEFIVGRAVLESSAFDDVVLCLWLLLLSGGRGVCLVRLVLQSRVVGVWQLDLRCDDGVVKEEALLRVILVRRIRD